MTSKTELIAYYFVLICLFTVFGKIVKSCVSMFFAHWWQVSTLSQKYNAIHQVPFTREDPELVGLFIKNTFTQ